MNDAVEIQEGLNSATLEVLKLIAWIVAARLPEDYRAEFHEMLRSLPIEFEPFRSMPVNSQASFSHVINAVADRVEKLG
ncbi:hypothetical protein ACCM60_14380 [Pseudomonas chlororaphis subsp. aureofaciens]|uniref:hypothetical protein n=1 Tax=Pseudomonas chlororaphis TaxID=587753 RepID=UPI003558BC83